MQLILRQEVQAEVVRKKKQAQGVSAQNSLPMEQVSVSGLRQETESSHQGGGGSEGGGGGDGFNRFFSQPQDDDGGPGHVLAAFEVPEADSQDEGELAQLECVDYNWPVGLADEGLSQADWLARFRQAPLSVLEVRRTSLPDVEAALPGEIVWFQIRYQVGRRKGQSDGYAYRSLFAPGQRIWIQKVSRTQPLLDASRPADFMDWLNAEGKYESAHVSELFHVLRLLRDASPTCGVAVYDVGQGTWQGILHKETGRPVIYTDVGGGVFYNSRTFPSGFGDPVQVPLVILSHWDWDHWSSAHRFRDLLKSTWLAPAVPDTPIQLGIAADVKRHGRLVVWNKAWFKELKEGCLRVEKCSGATSNDSGLAVTVYSRPARGRSCFLPGDAAYRYIASVNAGKEQFNALNMSHHGGRLHSTDYPLPKRAAVAVNSSGPRNTYKHPLFRTLSEHVANGWPMPAQTGVGGTRPCHVVLPWGEKPHFYQGACDLSGPSFAAAAAPVGAFVAPVRAPATATA